MTNDRPDLSSERAPHRDKTATFRQKVISGHKSQSGLDTLPYWLTVECTKPTPKLVTLLHALTSQWWRHAVHSEIYIHVNKRSNDLTVPHKRNSLCALEIYQGGVSSDSETDHYIMVTELTRFLWSSGQSSWLQMQRSGFHSRRYHIFWEVAGLERDPISLLSTIEELLERKSSGSGLETRDCGRRDPPRWLLETFYPQKLALTSLTSGGRSYGIVRSRTKTTELVI
jgi:hypothetical protein